MNNMLLITSKWDEKSTFRLIPTTLDCPYQEVIYIPDNKVLVVISKIPKQSFTMMPKLDDNGDYVFTKNMQPRPGSGKKYKEERKIVDSYMEYYIEEMTEIASFVTMCASNSSSFDFMKYLTAEVPKGEIAFADPEKVQSAMTVQQ